MADQELTFFRWARLRDFSQIGLSLRGHDVKEYINDGYLERTDDAVVLTEKGKEALTHEPKV